MLVLYTRFYTILHADEIMWGHVGGFRNESQLHCLVLVKNGNKIWKCIS